MPFGLKDKDIKQITSIFRLHNKVKEVLIFGSRAMGTERPGSDIDLAVKGESITVADLLKIRTQIDELPIAYECDIVDYHSIKTPEFKEHIDKHGIVLYGRKEKPSNWKTYRLGEIAQIIGGGTPSTSKEEYWNGEIGWLTPRDLTGYSYKHISKGERNITIEGLKNSSARLMPEGTVLMTSRAPIGYLAIADNELCTNQGFKSFIVDEDKINNEYLYYLLKSNIDRIKSLGTGSTFAEVSASILKELEIQAPDLITQTQITKILSSFDDKIELLQQMNQTLENIAQAIFKEWFVDFNFPGFDGELVNGLPKGWRMGKLGAEFNITMGQSPKGETLNQENEGMIFYQGRTDFGFRFPSNRVYTTEPNRIANKLNTLVCVRAPVGDINMAFEKCCIGRGLSSVIHKSNAYSYTYYSMKNIEPIFKGFESEGTVFGSLNKNNFENIELVVPSKELIKEFEQVTNPIDEKILNNSIQIQTITQTRDTLLLKLISGQLEIKN